MPELSRAIPLATANMANRSLLLCGKSIRLAKFRLGLPQWQRLAMDSLANTIVTIVVAGISYWAAMLSAKRQIDASNQQLERQFAREQQEGELKLTERLTQAAFDLDREWSAMIEHRTSAAVLVCEQPTRTLDVLDREVHSGQADARKAADLWTVIRFFQRLAVAVTNDQVNPALVPPLFGDDFIWWYVRCFEPQLKPIPSPGWEAWRHIDALHTWLSNHANPQDLAHWRARAVQ